MARSLRHNIGFGVDAALANPSCGGEPTRAMRRAMSTVAPAPRSRTQGMITKI